MDSEQLKQHIEHWCHEEEWPSFVEDIADSSAKLCLAVNVSSPSSARRNPLVMILRQPKATDRLVIEHQMPLPNGRTAAINAYGRHQNCANHFELDHLMGGRPGLLTLDVELEGNRHLIQLALTLWLDGVNNNPFLNYLIEMAKTRKILNELFYQLTLSASHTQAPRTDGPALLADKSGYCTQCGAQLRDGASFCTQCYTQIKRRH